MHRETTVRLRPWLYAWIGFWLGLFVGVTVTVAVEVLAAPPPRPEQPHSDQFEVAGFGNLAPLNPVNQKALQPAHTVSYRLLTMPGCVAGSIPADLQGMAQEMADKLRFSLVHDDVAYDFTIRINCGSEQIRICASVNVFCLGRGFPHVVDVDISDILSTWQPITRFSILCHEICAHAVATWMEQYCLGTETTGICRGLTLFTPAPGWRDIMNTGPLSRHGLEAIELERWSRTMYDVLAPVGCAGATDAFGNTWDNCLRRWVSPSGWRYDPTTGIWELPDGTPEWSACESWGGRYSFYKAIWMHAGQEFFAPERLLWSLAPLC